MPHGDILGFAPPLTITRDEVEEIVHFARAAAVQVCDEIAKEAAHA